jgi:hypothetical protein
MNVPKFRSNAANVFDGVRGREAREQHHLCAPQGRVHAVMRHGATSESDARRLIRTVAEGGPGALFRCFAVPR